MTAGAGAGIVVPVRSFRDAKTRLAPRLDAASRHALCRLLADRVVDAAGARPVVVVTGDVEVTDWAVGRGCDVIDDPGSLDAAAHAGVAHLAARGLVRAVVAHADLPLVTTLDGPAAPGPRPVAVVVPCRRSDGTPVLSVPTDSRFVFAYGPGSFRRHVAAARAAGLAVQVLHDVRLSHDLDDADDLEAVEAVLGAPLLPVGPSASAVRPA